MYETTQALLKKIKKLFLNRLERQLKPKELCFAVPYWISFYAVFNYPYAIETSCYNILYFFNSYFSKMLIKNGYPGILSGRTDNRLTAGSKMRMSKHIDAIINLEEGHKTADKTPVQYTCKCTS